ncbi:MAG: hypothetical protein HY042_07270, partial [Spirochaetia bacterium]|nr:hypothetical protein [Spirochaetia bacterium]
MQLYRISSVVLTTTLSLALTGISCGGGQPTNPEDEKGPILKIECDGATAIRTVTDRETKTLTEKGPVLLAQGMSCSDAKGLDTKGIRALKRNGVWETYYKEEGKSVGSVASRGEYKMNSKEGPWEFYDAKGRKGKVTLYKDGKKEGSDTSYFTDTGAVKGEGQNKDDKKTGVWKTRAAQNSDCYTEGSYSEDKRTGPWKECSQDEKTKQWYLGFQGSYKEDLRDGPAKVLYPDGKVNSEGTYAADLKCAETPPPEGKDACGRRTGRWVTYYPTGNKAMEGSYDAATGKKTGFWIEYYKSGEKMAEGERKHTRGGLWKFYDKAGTILYELKFDKNDNMPNYGVMYTGGRKIGEGGMSAALFKYEEATDNVKFQYKKSGKWTEYNPGGSVSGQGEYMMDIKMGKWVEHDQAG